MRRRSARSRPLQIMGVADAFLETVCQQLGKVVPGFPLEARRLVQSHPWPGNLRELRNVVERAAILSTGPVLEAADFPALAAPAPVERWQVGAAIRLQALETAQIQRVVANSGSLQEAARILKIDKSTLYRKRKLMDSQVAKFARGEVEGTDDVGAHALVTQFGRQRQVAPAEQRDDRQPRLRLGQLPEQDPGFPLPDAQVDARTVKRFSRQYCIERGRRARESHAIGLISERPTRLRRIFPSSPIRSKGAVSSVEEKPEGRAVVTPAGKVGNQGPRGRGNPSFPDRSTGCFPISTQRSPRLASAA